MDAWLPCVLLWGERGRGRGGGVLGLRTAPSVLFWKGERRGEGIKSTSMDPSWSSPFR